MKQMSAIVRKLSVSLDKLAGLCIFAVMLLIVSNIILRTIFSRPILGTYELAGFLTAIGIGLALAHCAWQNGHIAVTFVMDRLPRRMQEFTAVIVNSISLVFWTAASWYLVRFAQAMKLKGLVSPSAEIPVYPIIYLVAIGLLGLCLVLAVKLSFSIREAWESVSLKTLPFSLRTANLAKRAER